MFDPEDITALKMEFTADLKKLPINHLNFLTDLQMISIDLALNNCVNVEDLPDLFSLHARMIKFKLQFDKEQKGENI